MTLQNKVFVGMGVTGAVLLAIGAAKKLGAAGNLDILITDVGFEDMQGLSVTVKVKVRVNNPSSGSLTFTKPYLTVTANGSPVVTGTPSAEKWTAPARGYKEDWIPLTLNLTNIAGSVVGQVIDLFNRNKGDNPIELAITAKTDVGGVNFQSEVYKETI